MSSAGTSGSGNNGSTTNTTAPTTPPGLINTAPGQTTTTPGTPPAGAPASGAPVTGYNAAQASASTAEAAPTTVPTNATVQSQINDIIASGSPLMQQAESNAKNMMAQRGLINSSQAITAGQSAVIAAAEPIASQDAQTYAKASEDTAAAENAARLQNSSLETNTSQFNSGQTNAALSQEAAASNTVAQTAQTIAGQKSISDATNSVNQAIAQLQANTSLTNEQVSSATQQIIAGIQANTTLTAQDKQDLSQQVIAQMNNAAALQNIMAQGSINTQIQQIQGQFGQLTQTDQAAQQFYTQGLANLASIVNNTNLSEAQKAQALNDGVAELNSGLQAISQIANTPEVQSSLNFVGATDNNTGDLFQFGQQ